MIRSDELLNNILVRSSQFSYGDDQQRQSPLFEEIQEGPVIARRSYDESGNLLQEIRWEDEDILSNRRNIYEEGQLIAIIDEHPGMIIRRQFGYENEGTLISEDWYQNNVATRSIRYLDEDTRMEIYYRRGDPYINISYFDNEKIQEDYLRNGKIVSSRRFD